MEVVTAWVKSPPQVGGLDHLAVQAPCINIYGRLLPGITNVTDRARYYSFYPWLIWTLEQQGYRQYNDTFIDRFRKGDCLFTLIAEHHAQVSSDERENHAGALIGSNNLRQPIGKIREGESVRLSDYAHREERRTRYFKNTLGGLGQYYLGPFSELQILDGTARTGVKYTKQIGQQLAEAMDIAVDRKLFMETIEEDVVTPERLEQLYRFCPCQLEQSQREHRLLCDLFFVRSQFYHEDALPRRRTLQLLLHLADALAEERIALGISTFRGCVYSGSLPNGATWNIPERLQQNRKHWGIYQRNELLSIAVQGLFFILLDAYNGSDLTFSSTAELCAWFASGPEMQRVSDVFDINAYFEQITEVSRHWLPDLCDWQHPDHEIRLAEFIINRCRQHQGENAMTNRAEILIAALKILIALRIREETFEGYGNLGLYGNYLVDYPINLLNFLKYSQNEWSSLSLRELVIWLCSRWGVDAHLQVALRKLRWQSKATFRIRPSEYGLEVIEIPLAVHTSPRFNQAFRILRDLGVLVRADTVWVTSELGQQLKDFRDDS